MRSVKRSMVVIGALAVFSVGGLQAPAVSAETWPTEKGCAKVENPSEAMKGWCTAISRRKGNCLACHTAVVNPWPEALPPGGNIGPPFVAMNKRFKTKEELRAQIWDATESNPESSMPPFGKHKLISETDIDNIVEWLWSI